MCRRDIVHDGCPYALDLVRCDRNAVTCPAAGDAKVALSTHYRPAYGSAIVGVVHRSDRMGPKISDVMAEGPEVVNE
jgi:hypothetical protein